MLSIIYPYRDRDILRVENSLNSLRNQTKTTFEVYFVDYGSIPEKANIIKELCSRYSFVKYVYYYTRYQPWNKSKALNSVIKNLSTPFCLVADVDMIFHPLFVETAIILQKPEKTVFFQVGFLSKDDHPEKNQVENFDQYRKSNAQATGISQFPVDVLRKIRGFDEFYHFWGAEDSDVHIRLLNAGYEVEYYDQKVLMLHQWHKSYRLSEEKELTRDYQVSGIVQVNYRYFQIAQDHQRIYANINGWGNIMTQEEYQKMEELEVQMEIFNRKSEIDAFIFGYLPSVRNKVLKINFQKDEFQQSRKYRLKKILGMKVPEYYSLKEINDKLLLHLISLYRDQPYNYKISGDLEIITLSLKL